MKAGLLPFRDDFSERWVRRGKLFPKSAILKLGSLNPRVQGVVEPAASFVAYVDGRARTICVGPEEPGNAALFTECDCRGGVP
jgi:hypothetical protein